MKIVVAGGSGFIGAGLTRRLLAEGHQVTVLTRNAESSRKRLPPLLQVVQWDARAVGAWADHVSTADAIINFAGESIAAKRWTPGQKELIIGSRVNAARALVQAMGRQKTAPSVLISASAVGYYGGVAYGDVTETHPAGSGFLSATCVKWEREAFVAESLGVRVAVLRIAVVLGEQGGALEKMILPFRFFVGGPLGTGSQWFPWVHRDDIIGAAMFVLHKKELSGPVNVVAPEPVTMKQFCSALGKTLHRPSWVPVPSLLLRLALGEMSEMLLTGQRVVPRVLADHGYVFQYPHLLPALVNIVGTQTRSRHFVCEP
jgi:uncharacterized protein